MPTLAEYQRRANDQVLAGIYDEIITVDETMGLLNFKPIEGNSTKYNRESTHPTASVFTVGSTLTDSEPVTTQKSATLKEVYVQTPLDLFAAQTLGNIQSQRAVTFVQMSRAIGAEFARLLVKGDSAVTSEEFDGLDKLCRVETRMMAMDDGNVDGPGTAETELTLDRLDAMIDQVKPGRPDALIMNRTMKRKIRSLGRSAGSGVVDTDSQMFGRPIQFYGEIPIFVNDYITSAEIYADSGTWTSSTATTIFGVKFGEDSQGLDIGHNGTVLSPVIPADRHQGRQERGTVPDRRLPDHDPVFLTVDHRPRRDRQLGLSVGHRPTTTKHFRVKEIEPSERKLQWLTHM